MRCAIDISSIPYGTGVSRYTSNLVRALYQQINQDELILFGSALNNFELLKQFASSHTPNSPTRFVHYPPKLVSFVFNHFHPHIETLTGAVDIFHAWDWQIPSVSRAKLISTVHDVALFKYPDTAHPEIKAHHQQTLTYLKNHHHQVIAISNSTKNDLIELFGFDAGSITVIPEALPEEVKQVVSPQDLNLVKQKYGLQKPYFLMVGTKEKRKNIPNQVEAWRHYRQNYDLVIAGKPGWEDVKPTPGLITPGEVTGQELAALYQGATLLLYVSLYEGFGLPVLEAFYHQVPVVTSSTSSLPEVAGNAAVYSDPARPETIMMAIGKAIQNRVDLVQKGLIRLQAFSWDSVARQTLAVYRNLYAQN